MNETFGKNSLWTKAEKRRRDMHSYLAVLSFTKSTIWIYNRNICSVRANSHIWKSIYNYNTRPPALGLCQNMTRSFNTNLAILLTNIFRSINNAWLDVKETVQSSEYHGYNLLIIKLIVLLIFLLRIKPKFIEDLFTISLWASPPPPLQSN